MNELTREEYRFVIGLLDSMQLQGTAEQVRPALALRDSALEKLRGQLREAGSEGGRRKKNPEERE